jgi:hypothetical protein
MAKARVFLLDMKEVFPLRKDIGLRNIYQSASLPVQVGGNGRADGRRNS